MPTAKEKATEAKPPEREFQRDDLRNQTFYHVGLEYYHYSQGAIDKASSRRVANERSETGAKRPNKVARTRKRS